ncbi:MAG: hypothetical protein OIF47_05035 [Marinibacterium sp.]|nr:hypothetical protein [Marinibacterium sp.]
MRRFVFLAFFLIAIIAFLVSAYLLIPACALAHFTGIWDAGCERSDESADEQARLAARTAELQTRIRNLEQQLALIECTASRPVVIEDPLPPADRLPDGRGTDDGVDHGDDHGAVDPPLDRDLDPDPDPDADFADDGPFPGDTASLEGCWALESDFEIRSVESGDALPFPEWTVCFPPGSDGMGTQVMRSDDGALCEGDIRGAFDSDGALVLEEDEDLVCSDGTQIFRRVTTCAVGEDGLATCEAVQPRTGGRGTFALKRQS